MKKTFNLISLVIALIFLVSCDSDYLGDEESMNIKQDEIEQITVSTVMTKKKQDVVVENEKIEELIKKLNSYSIREIKDDEKKGWENLFKIEKKGGELLLISFMDKKVSVDGILYEVEGYKNDDFLYLFK